DSVLANDYPQDLLEVLVVDGMSTDGTREIVESCRRRPSAPNLRLVDNPAGIIPAAMNIGIREARGDVIVKMDAHAACSPTYLSQLVGQMSTHGADNVGGVLETKPVAHSAVS